MIGASGWKVLKMADDPVAGAVTRMISDLKRGDPAAASVLWERYFERLVEVARRQLGTSPRRVSDEEDVALNVLNSLCASAARGRCPDVADADDLWKLLLTICRQKTIDQVRKNSRRKRGAGRIRGESVFRGSGGQEASAGLDGMLADEPTPEMVAQLQEEHARLLGVLQDETLRQIAVWRLESYSNEEIAGRLGVSVSTVERKLKLIRTIWLAALDENAS